MKVYEYEPGEIEVDGDMVQSPFMGVVHIELLPYKDRLQTIHNLKLTDAKENSIEKAIEVIKLTEKHVKKVELKFDAGGEQITSLEELGYTKEGTDLINHIGRIVIQGRSLLGK